MREYNFQGRWWYLKILSLPGSSKVSLDVLDRWNGDMKTVIMQFGKLQLKSFCFLFPSQRGLEFNCFLFFPDYKSARQDHGSFMCLFFLFNFILMSSTAVDTVQPVLHTINKCKQDITVDSELGVKFCVALLPFSNI